MLVMEQGVNNGKRESAIKAKETGVDESHDLFNESSRDDGRHARTLDGLLKKIPLIVKGKPWLCKVSQFQRTQRIN
jgi:rubrerythrin